jgi:hypothetical protein
MFSAYNTLRHVKSNTTHQDQLNIMSAKAVMLVVLLVGFLAVHGEYVIETAAMKRLKHVPGSETNQRGCFALPETSQLTASSARLVGCSQALPVHLTYSTSEVFWA